jgi:hypothetical protein
MRALESFQPPWNLRKAFNLKYIKFKIIERDHGRYCRLRNG